MRTKRRTYQHSSRRHRLWPVLLALAVGLGLFLYTSDGLSLGTIEDNAGENTGIDLTSIFSRHKEPPETPDWVTGDLLTVNEYSRPGTELETVSGIVVHYVGNPGTTAQANRNYFEGLSETGETHASSHFVIGLEGEIIQCVPLDEIAYCSNDRNSDTISIECCHPGEDGAFTQETYDSLVKLVAFLTDYYDLGRDEVIRHYDVTGKLCPLYYVEHEDAWEQFKDDVFGDN